MDHTDLCEHTRIRLIAAAVGHQQCTKTESNIIPLPGGDRVIAIGTPAQVRALLEIAPMGEASIGVLDAVDSVTGDDIANIEAFKTERFYLVGDVDGLIARCYRKPGAPIDAISDDDLWHIALTVNTLANGSLFEVSQYDCVTTIRASFMDPDSGREYEKARGAALEGGSS